MLRVFTILLVVSGTTVIAAVSSRRGVNQGAALGAEVGFSIAVVDEVFTLLFNPYAWEGLGTTIPLVLARLAVFTVLGTMLGITAGMATKHRAGAVIGALVGSSIGAVDGAYFGTMFGVILPAMLGAFFVAALGLMLHFVLGWLKAGVITLSERR